MKKTTLSFSIAMALTGTLFVSQGFIGQALAQENTQVVAQATSQAVPQQQTAKVTKIDFKRNENGGGQLILEFDRPLASADVVRSGKDVVIQMDNALIPSHLSESIFVGDYNTPINSIKATNGDIDAAGRQQSSVRLTTNGDVKFPALFQSGPKFILEIDPLNTSTLLSGATLAAAQSVTANNMTAPSTNPYAGYTDTRNLQPVQPTAYATTPTYVRTAGPKYIQQSRPVAANTVTSYAGKPVTFNFQDVSVRTVLQLIADEAHINIVAADSVTGNITLKLDSVPWDQALDTILRAKSLDKRRQGSVLWVAPQKEIADYEQAKEDARIALDNRADLTTEYIQINYHNAAAIYKALTEAKGVGGGSGGGEGSSSNASETAFLSPRGRLVVDERTNMIMISDIPRKIQQLKSLIAVIDRPIDQVLIEARVVVATESFARELGARFGIGGITNNGRNALNSTIENNISNQNSYTNALLNGGPATFTRGIMSNTGVVNALGSAALSFLRGGFSLDMELSAMQRDGKGEVVSNPRIVTTNQREAVISQGKEVGYVTISNSQGSVPTPDVKFKEVLLEMRVTPTITNDGRVFLDMNVKKDEVEAMLNTGIGDVPQISKRQINTAVLVEDGQTVVVGGVYEFTDSNSVNKVPFLGDIPFLGNLFKKKGRSKEKAELLVFMTPKILKVAQPAQTIEAVRALLPREGTK